MDQTNLKRVHPPAFKAKVALEALKEQKTIAQLSSIYGIHSTQIVKWKHRAITGLESIFLPGTNILSYKDEELTRSLYEQIGRLKIETDWLKKKIGLIEK